MLYRYRLKAPNANPYTTMEALIKGQKRKHYKLKPAEVYSPVQSGAPTGLDDILQTVELSRPAGLVGL